MGYLGDADNPEQVPVIMYDGAAGRADVGRKVSFVTPSQRFKDGAQLKVSFFIYFFVLEAYYLVEYVD